MSLIIVGLGICVLLLLMIRFHFNAFIALILVSLLVGVAEGLDVKAVLTSITTGVGSTLGSIALILAFGAMLGKLVEESGAAHTITHRLVALFGERHIQWAVLLTSFIVGIPMIYNAGFLVIIPLLYTIATATKKPLLFLGLPMCAALSTAHGLLPPHPAPSSIAVLFSADINLTLLLGFIVSIPAVILGGPVLSRFFRNTQVEPPAGLYSAKTFAPAELPGIGVSLLITVLPVLLMLIAVIADLAFPGNVRLTAVTKVIGDPNVALLLAVLAGFYFLGVRRGRSAKNVMNALNNSLGSIAVILLIIAAGGAFKQVLIDSHVADAVKQATAGLNVSPLILAWCLSAAIRGTLGSATVAAITSAGIMLPLVAGSGIKPELMVLATSSGSLMFSHVNDIGFWMFKEYFNLTLKQTFLSWSIMEAVISITGLIGVLLLSAVL